MFKDIPGYEGLYRINPYGIVISIKDGKIRKKKWVSHDKGYPRVGLSNDNNRKNFEVHRLVAMTYLGTRPDGLVINHKDGNKYNNHVSNLEYCTTGDNTRHAHRIGLVNFKGENNGNSKLSDRDIEIIRRLYERTNLTQLEIASVFDIKSAHTSNIVRYATRIEQDKEHVKNSRKD